jgi:hypothetical protein
VVSRGDTEILHSTISHIENILTNQLEDLLEGESIIPYDIDQRKRKFAKAFEKLNKFM